ncbi:MAG: hypothetical protein K1X47_08670 [Cyclobacteriaceae bacterium]|nr:hypothetical protein [Cyclobacteriaceae bacterium]
MKTRLFLIACFNLLSLASMAAASSAVQSTESENDSTIVLVIAFILLVSGITWRLFFKKAPNMQI